jgi:hypothetical protein
VPGLLATVPNPYTDVCTARGRAAGERGTIDGRKWIVCRAATDLMSALEIAKTLYKTPAMVSHRVRCGKPNCRCASGEGHGPYHFLHWRQCGIQRRCYVRRADVEAVRAVIERRHWLDRERRLLLATSRAELRSLRSWLKDLETG